MTDFSPAMLGAAQREAEARGLENVELRVLDAQDMDFDDASFDSVICRWGYMLMPDPAAAVSETFRVLRDGGRVSFAVWAEPERNLWASISGKAMVELGHQEPPEPGAPSMFAFADHDRIRELVSGAGFAEPQIEQVQVRWGWTGGDQLWEKTLHTAGPLVKVYESVEAEEQERIRTTVTSRVEERINSGDPLDGITNVVVAEKR
jgi:SAM-dependent methyltransferase